MDSELGYIICMGNMILGGYSIDEAYGFVWIYKNSNVNLQITLTWMKRISVLQFQQINEYEQI